jgi:hypothetical protein
MGMPYSMNGKVYTRFWSENLEEKDHWGDLDVDEWIILRWILENQNVGVVKIHLAQGRHWWWALLNMGMDLQVP